VFSGNPRTFVDVSVQQIVGLAVGEIDEGEVDEMVLDVYETITGIGHAKAK